MQSNGKNRIEIGKQFPELYKDKTGRGLRSTGPIHLIFERKLSFIIIHHPAKFYQNRSRTV